MFKFRDQQMPKKAILLATKILDDKNLSKVDRMHFLIARALFLGFYNEWEKDIMEVQELTKNDIECFVEYMIFYG